MGGNPVLNPGIMCSRRTLGGFGGCCPGLPVASCGCSVCVSQAFTDQLVVFSGTAVQEPVALGPTGLAITLTCPSCVFVTFAGSLTLEEQEPGPTEVLVAMQLTITPVLYLPLSTTVDYTAAPLATIFPLQWTPMSATMVAPLGAGTYLLGVTLAGTNADPDPANVHVQGTLSAVATKTLGA